MADVCDAEYVRMNVSVRFLGHVLKSDSGRRTVALKIKYLCAMTMLICLNLTWTYACTVHVRYTWKVQKSPRVRVYSTYTVLQLQNKFSSGSRKYTTPWTPHTLVCEKVTTLKETVSVQYNAKVTTLENTVSVHCGG